MQTETQPFGKIINAALDEVGLDKSAVAAEAGMHVATLYRYLGGSPVPKGNALALIKAINKLSMFSAVDEAAALRAAGYQAEPRGDVDEFIIASVIDHMALLPREAQLDALEVVKALSRRHSK